MPELTDAAVRKYKSKPKRREIPDSNAGLFLIIQPSGKKSFAMRFRRPDGRSAKLHLGPYDPSAEPADEPIIGAPLTLAMARQLAAKVQRDRKRGIDVIAEEKARKQRQRSEHEQHAANMFGGAVREFFIDHLTKQGSRPRGWRANARLLGLDWPHDCDPAKIEPRIIPGGLATNWADKPLVSIDAHDIHTMVDEARHRGIPGLPRRNKSTSASRGRRMHAILSVFFRWAWQRRKVASNPCVGVWHPGAPAARDRWLSDAEIGEFWRAGDRIDPTYGALFKILLATGCRLNEAAGMRRVELSENGATWTIPSERTKNHRVHIVPLTPLVQAIIDGVPRIADEFVFSTNGKRQVTSFSLAKKQLDKAMGAPPPWRLHDLRRTAATGMATLGIAPHIVEACLNHVSGAKAGVAGVYNRAAYGPEKKAALERWAAHIEGLVADKPTNVVNMPARGTA